MQKDPNLGSSRQLSILAKLINFSKSRMRWIWKGQDNTSAALQTFLTKILILATNLANGIITARLLGPEGRGEQAAMILWPQFLAYAMSLGLFPALIYNLKRHSEKKAEFFSAALVMSLGYGLLATAIGIIFIPQWLAQYSPDTIHFAQALMLTSPLSLISITSTITSATFGDFSVANRANSLTPFITLLILILLLTTQQVSPFATAMAYTFPSIPITIWLVSQHRHLLKLQKWLSFGKFYKQLFGYGFRSAGADILSMVSTQVDQVLVIGMLSPTSMGHYTIALSLSRMLDVFQGSIITVLFPRIAACPVEEASTIAGQSARVSTLLITPVALALIILGPALLNLIYGPEFLESVLVFQVLTIEIVINSITLILIQVFLAVGRPEMVTFLQGFGLILSIPLMMSLIPKLGVLGAGLSLLISAVARLIFVLSSYPLILKIKSPKLLVSANDFQFLLSRLKQNSASS